MRRVVGGKLRAGADSADIQHMRALSIRQPYAELILRGIKTVEYRSRATSIVGERFYIYASKTKLAVDRWQLAGKSRIVGDNIVAPGEPLPGWMMELAEQVGMIEDGALLPTGVIVGSAIIEKCERIAELHRSSRSVEPYYQWHLSGVERAKRLRKPKGHPQPVWFRPF
jgi:hypothetical protein